ncbi:S9 family peptidase, partial [candidate division KSB1 bacterium]
LTGRETRLTKGGKEELMNGVPDWVYPEELNQREAFWWSYDSKKIAYLQFDERPVLRYPLVHQLTPDGKLELERYPKAGAPNPVVKIFVIDINTKKIIKIDTGNNPDVYIFKVRWLKDRSEISFQRLNRRQNVLEFLIANPETGRSKVIVTEKEDCFVNTYGELHFVQINKSKFLWTSERTGWRHIYLYDFNGNLLNRVTQGEWPVGRIVGVDRENEWVYFTGYKNRGLESHIFRVKLNGENLTKLSKEPGTHFPDVAPFCRFYIDSYSSFDVPRTVTLYQADGTKLREIGKATKEKYDSLHLIKPELISFKAADGKTDLNGIIYKPADFNPEKAYPLICSVYGGPLFPRVRNSFYGTSFEHALAQLGFIVFVMDNRGTPNRGKKFETATYLKLGQVDLADQVAGVKFVTQRPYIDGKRVGIYGGSYGGYMTCMALLAAPDVYHVGVARAPVTDWKNYDSIYTERYMQRPQDNPDGYKKGSALTYAENLKGKLLIMHGTVDNNVHPANTIQLINELIKLNKRFDMIMMPEQRHGFRGQYGKYSREIMVEYFIKHLKP